MDSDEENIYVDESDEDVSDDDHMNMVMEPEVSSTTHDNSDDDFPHQVLSPALIVQHMIDCINDVNSIVQVFLHTFWLVTIGHPVSISNSIVVLFSGLKF